MVRKDDTCDWKTGVTSEVNILFWVIRKEDNKHGFKGRSSGRAGHVIGFICLPPRVNPHPHPRPKGKGVPTQAKNISSPLQWRPVGSSPFWKGTAGYHWLTCKIKGYKDKHQRIGIVGSKTKFKNTTRQTRHGKVKFKESFGQIPFQMTYFFTLF